MAKILRVVLEADKGSLTVLMPLVYCNVPPVQLTNNSQLYTINGYLPWNYIVVI